MTAPDMVGVIAAALRGHSGDNTQDEWWICCSCGTNWFIERYSYSDAKDEFSAHQARAVLAAISEAGAVEWGVENGHTPIDHVDETDDQDEAVDIASDRRGIGIPARAVSRITGPWTAVEV